jgi:hypothetical protein
MATSSTVMHLLEPDYRGLRSDFMLKMNNHMNLGFLRASIGSSHTICFHHAHSRF